MDVVFPDGTVVRASSIRDRVGHDPARSFGLYLDMRWLPTWPAEVIEWPDFGLPADGDRAAGRVAATWSRWDASVAWDAPAPSLPAWPCSPESRRTPPWIGSGVSTTRPRSKPAPRSNGCGGSPTGSSRAGWCLA